MQNFDPGQLRTNRLRQEISATEVARRMMVSPAQIHRLENGDRRLTVDTLILYCDAIHISVGQLFAPNVMVPVTGVIDSDFEIQPLPPNAPDQILAPPLMEDMSQVASVRWAASRRFAPMRDHAVFYDRHENGIPEFAWDKRCVILRRNGSQCLGWPTQQNGSVHINFGEGPVDFDVDVVWASPVIAVMPPFAIAGLQLPM
jgi:transcriptional regulator with XRE-family HTH domain